LCERYIDDENAKPGRRFAAMRALVAMDGLDIRREANDAGERNADKAAAASVLQSAYRAALENPETLEHLLAIDKALAAPVKAAELLPAEPTHPNHRCGDANCWCSRVTGWDAGEEKPNPQ
jgi:hypothetical protein